MTHWLLADPELLEAVKEAAAQYKPSFRPDDIFCHDVDASYDQATFRFYQAGSSLSSPTAEADESVDLTLEQEGAGNYALQLWIVINQTDASADLLRTKAWKLQVSHNGGTYTDVDSAAQVNMVADSGFADGDAITALPTGMSAGNGSFINGEAEEATDTTDNITFTQDAQTHTVCCWSIEVVDTQVAATDTLDFRVVESDSTVLANNATSDKPRITWASAATEVTPTAASSTYSAPNPTLTLSTLSVTPQTPVATYSAPSPSADLSALTATVTAATSTYSAPSPSASFGQLGITPTAASAAWGVGSPSMTLGAVSMTPTAASAAYGIGTPSASLGGAQNLTPTAAVAAWSDPNPGTSLGAVEMTPTAAVAAWSAPASALTLGPISATIAFTTASWGIGTPSTPGASVVELVGRDRLGRRSYMAGWE